MLFLYYCRVGLFSPWIAESSSAMTILLFSYPLVLKSNPAWQNQSDGLNRAPAYAGAADTVVQGFQAAFANKCVSSVIKAA